MVVLLAALWWRAAGTPPLILVAALVPAALYAIGITSLDRRAAESPSLLIAAFLWGAVVAASAAAAVNGLLQAWLSVLSSSAEASTLVPRLAAPIVEELAKGAALVVVVTMWPERLESVVDGIVYGILVGLGFAVSENLLYLTMAVLQGGYGGLLRSAYLRGAVYGLNHAVFTALTGAAVGYARATPSRVAALIVPPAGFAAAAGVHVLWNTVASDAIARILCAAPAPEATCQNPPPAQVLYVTVPLVVALFIGPCVAALLAAGLLSRGRSS